MKKTSTLVRDQNRDFAILQQGIVAFYKVKDDPNNVPKSIDEALEVSLDAVALDGDSWLVGKGKFYEEIDNNLPVVESLISALATTIQHDKARQSSPKESGLIDLLRNWLNAGMKKENEVR